MSPRNMMKSDKKKIKITVCEMEMKVSGLPGREKRTGESRGGCVQDGLSSDRLTEVMRGEDESEEHDSRIQIQNRLTLLEYVSLSKSSYPIYCIPLRTHTHISTSVFYWALISIHIALPILLSVICFPLPLPLSLSLSLSIFLSCAHPLHFLCLFKDPEVYCICRSPYVPSARV